MSIQTLIPNEPFRANRYLTERQSDAYSSQTETSFQKVIEALTQYLEQTTDPGDQAYLRRQRAAIIGEPAAKSSFIQMIQEFLREHPEYNGTKYPSYYPNLPEALFQHHLGFGPMSVWFSNPIESAMVNGTQILFSQPGKNTKVIQPFSYDSIAQVEKLIRSITLKDPTQQVTATENWTEVDMHDGTRVTIFTPPMCETYVLVFRQYPFKMYTFEQEAKHRTIPQDSIRWFKFMSQLMFSTLTTGLRGSGKTTMIKVIFGARDKRYGVVTVERGSFEAHLKRDFPDRASYIIPLKASGEDMNALFPAFLRADAHYIMVPEIRAEEVDLAIQSKERGNGWLGSYHGQHVLNIPLELTDLSLELRANRNANFTYKRTAQCLDVVITMWEDSTGRKIVTGVYAYEYDHETESFSVTTWMKYNRSRDEWLFNAQIPPKLRERVEEMYPEILVKFEAEFRNLAEAHPLEGQTIQTVKIGG